MSAKNKDIYDPAELEPRWQDVWRASTVYDTARNAGSPTCYILDMFPYPSGNSMHVGHPRGYVATDVYTRFKRMSGFQVLHPMGWDSFGLPAEETAIANKEYPTKTVDRNIALFKSQLVRLGLSYDWTHEIKTSDPAFYKHTQRLFLEFFRRGLAYNAMSAVNWCPALSTVLANEDIEDGLSEQGGHPVEQISVRQWMLRITAYADRLLDDLDRLTAWPEKIKKAQAAWIGRSKGYRFSFTVSTGDRIEVFTTRIETLAGTAFLALAPELGIARQLGSLASNGDSAFAYIERARAKTDRNRQVGREKTGLVLKGISAVNPLTGAVVPVLLADYVLGSYGTGAIMGVPAHDQRDEEMADALNIAYFPVIDDNDKLINCGEFDGFDIPAAREKIAAHIGATDETRFKMRDWVFSRQRFWGEPFPILWVEGRAAYDRCAAGAIAPWLPKKPIFYKDNETLRFAVPIVPEHLEAARLPVVESYEPTGEPSGPLAGLASWVNVWLDPETGAVSESFSSPGLIPARRETNTMPQWAGSSWYWLRFMDPRNDTEPFSARRAMKWGAVDLYAGADHAVAHLIYARFWQKVLFDAGLVDHDEPFERLAFLGHVLAADGSKISKRKNNGRNPDDVIAEVGADTLRLYEMAIGPFEKAAPWIDADLIGYRRFLNRVVSFGNRVVEDNAASSDADVEYEINRCIACVSKDIEAFKFNTAVSYLIIFLKEADDRTVSLSDFGIFVRLLAPFAPHLAEELWAKLGYEESVHLSPWPKPDRQAVALPLRNVPVQINGRKRTVIELPSDANETTAKDAVLANPVVQRWIAGASLRRFVYVRNRIVNIVVTEETDMAGVPS